ncbi:kininogen-1 [Stegastes partitus]|uniref:Kininogen-1-like n=1 Tax=Stegastes partitus TaxID=144197 RepID=A0A3B5A2G3_9TELE|nr:PREDICTED: kininogen-1-like [Stegastes partitus]XP_008292883.1 PREDICTED: kininogen-1-like [Stegastes partitus]
MRIGVGLCVLGLLCLHSSVFGQDVDVQPGVLIFCDDPSVEMAINSAVSKFNEQLNSGHKLAVYQILSASKSENGSDSVYSLQFTSRRSNCAAGSSKPWTECDYLPSGRKEPISCNATVYITEMDADTTQVDCLVDDYIVPERAQCLGCPVEIDENSEDLRNPLYAAVSRYNAISDSTHLFTLHSLGLATRQVVAGFRFKLRFDLRKTKCAKSEHQDLNELCIPDEENVEFANCNSTVDVAPWRHEPPQAHVECEPGALPPMLYTRRRPPGWSPLRNLLYNVPSSSSSSSSSTSSPPPPPPPPPSQSPSPTPTKEESSEEDTTASKPSAVPIVTVDAVNDNPFHCPSKPWKAFNPTPAAAPTKASMEVASPQPTVEGTFSDKDLLA